MSSYTYSILHIGAQHFTGAEFGEGSGPVFLEGIACIGTEEKLLECQQHVPLGRHRCGHSEDAGVFCEGT